MVILPSLWPVVIGAAASTVIAIGWYGVVGSPQTSKKSKAPIIQKLGEEQQWAHLVSAFASYLLMAFAVGMLLLALDVQGVQGTLLVSLVAWAGYLALNAVNGRLLWRNAGLMILLLTLDALLVYAFDIM